MVVLKTKNYPCRVLSVSIVTVMLINSFDCNYKYAVSHSMDWSRLCAMISCYKRIYIATISLNEY